MRTILAMVAVACLGHLATTAHAATPPTHIVAANAGDPAIDTSRGSNYIWLAPPAKRVGKLLLFMPSGGPTNLPQDWTEMGAQGGLLGYHTLVLAYKNEAPIAALPPAGCGNSVEP